MQRSDWLLIGSLVVLGTAAKIALAVLTLVGASEYLKFALVIGLFVAILVARTFTSSCQRQKSFARSATLDKCSLRFTWKNNKKEAEP
jgi:uncharacterized membrane-anchored protein YhcB (DUF1043 family)